MSRSRVLRMVPFAGAAGLLAAAGLVALTTSPALAASGTTVTPAGHGYTASLASGTDAVFTVGTTKVTCNLSDNEGTVPDAPGNTVIGGSVVSTVTSPTFKHTPTQNNPTGKCLTNVIGNSTYATSVSNETNGKWTISLQYTDDKVVAKMTIPRGGVVTTTSGLAVCTVTVGTTGPVEVEGTWIPGTATTLPRMVFANAKLNDIKVTGSLFCPSGANGATFSATYEIADKDATQQITVSDAVAQPTDPPTTEPTVNPTTEPTVDPTDTPTVDPTTEPTVDPTDTPTVDPTTEPTVDPTDTPTVDPTDTPTVDPTDAPSL